MNKVFMRRLMLLALVVLVGVAMNALAQDTDTGGGDVDVLVSETVVMTVSAPTDFTPITEADISAGTKVNSSAFTITVEAITDFSVDAQLTAVVTDSLEVGIAAPVGSSMLIGATASGAGGTTAVADTAFSNTLSTPVSLGSAFSGVNNADGTGESSTISLTLDMDQLGNRDQGETLTYTLEFIVTEE